MIVNARDKLKFWTGLGLACCLKLRLHHFNAIVFRTIILGLSLMSLLLLARPPSQKLNMVPRPMFRSIVGHVGVTKADCTHTMKRIIDKLQSAIALHPVSQWFVPRACGQVPTKIVCLLNRLWQHGPTSSNNSCFPPLWKGGRQNLKIRPQFAPIFWIRISTIILVWVCSRFTHVGSPLESGMLIAVHFWISLCWRDRTHTHDLDGRNNEIHTCIYLHFCLCLYFIIAFSFLFMYIHVHSNVQDIDSR